MFLITDHLKSIVPVFFPPLLTLLKHSPVQSKLQKGKKSITNKPNALPPFMIDNTSKAITIHNEADLKYNRARLICHTLWSLLQD
jgi:hypothetical protein